MCLFACLWGAVWVYDLKVLWGNQVKGVVMSVQDMNDCNFGLNVSLFRV